VVEVRMEWWQTLLVALATFIVTKAVDYPIDLSKVDKLSINGRVACRDSIIILLS